MASNSFFMHRVVGPLRDAAGARADYLLEHKSRLLALVVAVALLAAFLFLPVEDLTGTAWAVYLQILAAVLLARLSAGFALHAATRQQHLHAADPMGFGAPPDADNAL